MKWLILSKRTAQEILRDPLNLGFGIGFPVILLLLLSAIQANVPVSLFAIEQLAPGIAVFGLAFLTLFAASLVAKDRESAFLSRLYTTPLTAADFILGYLLPVLPIALLQSLITYGVAILLGLSVSVRLLLALVLILPIALFFIAMGLLCGSVLNVKQAGAICGALFTNLTAWLSGTWFDLELVGGVYKKIAYALPFVHAVELERAAVNGNFSAIGSHLIWVLAYGVAAVGGAVWLFLRQMKRQ